MYKQNKKSKNNELTTLEFYKKNADPKIFTISESNYLGKDLISVTSTTKSNQVITEVYKFTDKSLQTFDSNYIKSGIYKSNNKEVPYQTICEKKTLMAQLADYELSGKGEKDRLAYAEKIAKEAADKQAKLNAIPYQVIFSCYDGNKSGMDLQAAQGLITTFFLQPGMTREQVTATVQSNLSGYKQWCHTNLLEKFDSKYFQEPPKLVRQENDRSYFIAKVGGDGTWGLVRFAN